MKAGKTSVMKNATKNGKINNAKTVQELRMTMIDEITYRKLCDKYSTRILQRIICPYCGFVYSKEESIDIGIMNDCEDTGIIICKKCNHEFLVNSWVTEYRFSSSKLGTE